MRIALDAMGCDARPVPDVAGAVLAAREWGDEIVLVGPQAIIEQELAKYQTAGLKLEIVHAEQVIAMEDKPSDVIKGKPDSSMHVGLKMLEEQQVDAFVTMGNTGVVLGVSMLVSPKRIKGIKRPALTAIFPNMTGYLVAADIGANADCPPEYLVQFGMMASIYAELALGVKSPRVALLSNGEEEGKGNNLIHEATVLMREANFNYIGNVEPKEALAGATDIVIHDGFTGNIFIKSIESAASMVGKLIKAEITANPVTAVGGLLAKGAFNRVSKRTDPFEIGGAPLLGIDGVVILGHGRSNDIAVKNGIRQARQAVEGNVIQVIKDSLA